MSTIMMAYQLYKTNGQTKVRSQLSHQKVELGAGHTATKRNGSLYLHRSKEPRSHTSDNLSTTLVPSVRSSSLDSSVGKNVTAHEHTCGKEKEKGKEGRKPRRSASLAPTLSSSPATQYITVNHYHRGCKNCRRERDSKSDKAVQTDPILQNPFQAPASGEKTAQSEHIPQNPFPTPRSSSSAPAAASFQPPFVHSTAQPASLPPNILFNLPPHAPQHFPPPPPQMPQHMYFAPSTVPYYNPQPFAGTFDPPFRHAQHPAFLRQRSVGGIVSKHSPNQGNAKDLTEEDERILIGIHEHYEKNHPVDAKSSDDERDRSRDENNGESTNSTVKHQHVCVGCGNVRSTSYQLKHPIMAGKQPKADLCRRCESRNIRTDSDLSDRMRARRSRQLSISYHSAPEKQENTENSHKRDQTSANDPRDQPHSPGLPARREQSVPAEYSNSFKTDRPDGKRQSDSSNRLAAYPEESRRQSERVNTDTSPPSRRPSTSYRREPKHFGTYGKAYQPFVKDGSSDDYRLDNNLSDHSIEDLMAATELSPRPRRPSITFRHVPAPTSYRSQPASPKFRTTPDDNYRFRDDQGKDFQAPLFYRCVSASIDHSWNDHPPSFHGQAADFAPSSHQHEGDRAANPALGIQDENLRRARCTYYNEDEPQEFSLDEWERQEELAAKQREQGWKWSSDKGPTTFFVDNLDGGRATPLNPLATNNAPFLDNNHDGDWELADPEDWGDVGEASIRTPGIFDDYFEANEYAHLRQAQAPYPTSPQNSRRHSRKPSYTYSEAYEIPEATQGLGLRLINEGEQSERRRERRTGERRGKK